MRLNAEAIKHVIEEDLARAVGMTKVTDKKKQNPANSFTGDDMETILKLVDDYAAAKVTEYKLAEAQRAAARASRGLRRSA